MKQILFFILATSCGIAGCKKEIARVQPIANFTVTTETVYGRIETLTRPTYDGFTVANKSTDADSYFWDLGNGSTSTDKEFSSYYQKAGTYTLTLTAINKDGKRSSISKNIRVLDRVLKQIIVPALNWKSALAFLSTSYPLTKANVWVEIQQGEAGRWDYPVLNNGVMDIPVVYKSPVALDVDPGSVPIIFNVTQKFIFEYPILFKGQGYTGRGYIFNLYAQDTTGVYILMSSFGSTIGYSRYGSLPDNKFTVTTGFDGSKISLNCDYE